MFSEAVILLSRLKSAVCGKWFVTEGTLPSFAISEGIFFLGVGAGEWEISPHRTVQIRDQTARSVQSDLDLHCQQKLFEPPLAASRYTLFKLQIGNVGKQPAASKEYCAEYLLKELQKSTDRCTGRLHLPGALPWEVSTFPSN